MITLYTIGFTKKSAEQFFELLKAHHVWTLVDVRISNSSQLAGFAKGSDLTYFLQQIGGIGYRHITDFAPTKKLLSDPTTEMLQAFGAWGEKKLYGKVSMGTLRKTFIFDENGILERIIEKVDTKNHAEQIL